MNLETLLDNYDEAYEASKRFIDFKLNLKAIEQEKQITKQIITYLENIIGKQKHYWEKDAQQNYYLIVETCSIVRIKIEQFPYWNDEKILVTQWHAESALEPIIVFRTHYGPKLKTKFTKKETENYDLVINKKRKTENILNQKQIIKQIQKEIENDLIQTINNRKNN